MALFLVSIHHGLVVLAAVVCGTLLVGWAQKALGRVLGLACDVPFSLALTSGLLAGLAGFAAEILDFFLVGPAGAPVTGFRRFEEVALSTALTAALIFLTKRSIDPIYSRIWPALIVAFLAVTITSGQGASNLTTLLSGYGAGSAFLITFPRRWPQRAPRPKPKVSGQKSDEYKGQSPQAVQTFVQAVSDNVYVQEERVITKSDD